MKVDEIYKAETGENAFHYSHIGQKLYSNDYILWLEDSFTKNAKPPNQEVADLCTCDEPAPKHIREVKIFDVCNCGGLIPEQD